MSDKELLLPVYNKKTTSVMKTIRERNFLSMKYSVPFLVIVCVSIALMGFLFCVVWSIMYNFEEANATHCSVENYLPSLSAAIGHFYPQIYVWNAAIVIQMIFRLKLAKLYFQYLVTVIYEKYFNLCYLAWIFYTYELWTLLGLSFITSTLNYNIHAFCFVSFLLSSMFYMILTSYLLKFQRKIPPEYLETKSMKWKMKCCLINIFSFLLAGYFFRRHNVYCEPKVYSLFAFFEYCVVVSNIFFHFTTYWDFYDKTMTIDFTSRGFQVSFNPPFKSVEFDNK